MKKRYTFLVKNCLFIGLVAVFAVGAVSASAQTAPAKIWDKTFGGNLTDILWSIQQTSDGGYILGGTSGSNISGDKSQSCQGLADYWVVKLDANGNKTWDKTFGGSMHDELHSIQQTSDGGYILGGFSNSGISGDKSQASKGNNDFWVVKLDASGNKLWDKTFGGSSEDELYSLQQTVDGGYILGGYSNSGISGDKTLASKGDNDYWVVKLDASGNKTWDKTFGGSMFDELYSLKQTSDGGYILGGLSNSGISGDKSQASKGSYDFWVLKLNTNGNKLWDKTFGGNGPDGLQSLQQTSDGGYILGGGSWSGISGDKSQPNSNEDEPDFWIVKVDSAGNKLWDKAFGTTDSEELSSVQQTSDGGYILGGVKGNNYTSFLVVKTNATGNIQWEKTFGGIEDDALFSLQQTSDGGYILGGLSNSGISGDKSQVSKGSDDFWVVKLGAEITGTKEPFSNSQLTLSPNPNQGKFKLQLENIAASKVEVCVSDLLGRVNLQKELQVTNKQVSEEFEIKAAKGLYLLQIKAGNQTTSRKIVVE